MDLANVEYDVEFSVSDVPIEGNVMASGSALQDRKAEQWVESELNLGNEFAWCDVVVTAKLGEFKGLDSLGAVSAQNKEEAEAVVNDHGMRENALEDLRMQLLDAGAIRIEE